MSALASLGGKPVRDSFLPFSLPTIEEDEVIEVVNTLKSGWITTGPKTKLFEKKISEYCNAQKTLAVSSATAGLEFRPIQKIGIGFWAYYRFSTDTVNLSIGHPQVPAVPTFEWSNLSIMPVISFYF